MHKMKIQTTKAVPYYTNNMELLQQPSNNYCNCGQQLLHHAVETKKNLKQNLKRTPTSAETLLQH
jgi:hypothetical protein